MLRHLLSCAVHLLLPLPSAPTALLMYQVQSRWASQALDKEETEPDKPHRDCGNGKGGGP